MQYPKKKLQTIISTVIAPLKKMNVEINKLIKLMMKLKPVFHECR